MRLRALPLLLALTAADYALWDWSIANGHDIVSLVSGLTLLPLAAATLAMLAIGAARLVGFGLERSASGRRNAGAAAGRGRAAKHGRTATHGDATATADTRTADEAARERSSRRLAA
ncbi:MAG TPA: hypothetical protein VGY30_09990 [Solirubrobacteraceae bacterium]|nr:hypothetical protein [Solirubrobacteraceae bacterium]